MISAVDTDTFLKVRNLTELSHQLRISRMQLLSILDNSQESYRTFRLRKKKGGYREIGAPVGILKTLQQSLNFHLQRIYLGIRPSCVHGFISNFDKKLPTCNIATNAAAHVGNEFVLNMDLEDFFHSVDRHRVKSIFMSYPFYFDNSIASYLTILTTLNDRLPMGAPTSPVISNLACFLLDRRLMRFARKHSLTYTRYADDLTFSSKLNIDESVVQQITSIIVSESFRVNEKKTRIFSSKRRQSVTGLKVNEKVNVDRKFIRSIRAMLHNWEKKGLHWAAQVNLSENHFLNHLNGKLMFLRMVRGKDDTIYRRLNEKYSLLRETTLI